MQCANSGPLQADALEIIQIRNLLPAEKVATSGRCELDQSEASGDDGGLSLSWAAWPSMSP